MASSAAAGSYADGCGFDSRLPVWGSCALSKMMHISLIGEAKLFLCVCVLGWGEVGINDYNYFMLINHSGLLSLDMCKPFPSGA